MNSKERPIIFSTEMVRALLDRRKFQTRRLIKDENGRLWDYPLDSISPWMVDECPHGKVGDKLWVREKIYCFDGHELPKTKPDDFGNLWHYGCDYATNIEDSELDTVTKTISPIFMPRWCSRIELVLTEVSIERLQHISEEDAIAEGLTNRYKASDFPIDIYSYGRGLGEYFDPILAFSALWDTINTADGTKFVDDPWVWVLKFDVQTNAKSSI